MQGKDMKPMNDWEIRIMYAIKHSKMHSSHIGGEKGKVRYNEIKIINIFKMDL